MVVSWSEVGEWIKENAGHGASLVGSLLTGNVPAAMAAGVAMVSDAAGTDDPTEALHGLRHDPEAVARLRELAVRDRDNIRRHVEAMAEMELSDHQASHATTQQTIREGDRAEDGFVRRTRPGQSWASLIAAIAYVFHTPEARLEIVIALLTLPWAYAGLRQVGKGVDAVAGVIAKRKEGRA